jgi:hypothetical protein
MVEGFRGTMGAMAREMVRYHVTKLSPMHIVGWSPK